MKAVVDSSLCIGCGLCEDACPEVLRLADDGIATVISESPDPELYGAIRDAADLCPVEAIDVSE